MIGTLLLLGGCVVDERAMDDDGGPSVPYPDGGDYDDGGGRGGGNVDPNVEPEYDGGAGEDHLGDGGGEAEGDGSPSDGGQLDSDEGGAPPPTVVHGDIVSGCGNAKGDVYAFEAPGGSTIAVTVDTVSASTASDMWAMVFGSVEAPLETNLGWHDDAEPCTYPPPAYECPVFEVVLPEGDVDLRYLFVGDTGHCANRGLSEYLVAVTVDGVPTELSLVTDEAEVHYPR